MTKYEELKELKKKIPNSEIKQGGLFCTITGLKLNWGLKKCTN